MGGLGVELGNGLVTRDHPDTDIAIFRDDLETFYDYVSQNRGRMFRSLTKNQLDDYKSKYGREPEIRFQDGVHTFAYIQGKEEFQDTYSPFVSFEGGEIDLDIIDIDPVTGECPLLGDTGITFNRSQYNEPKTIEVNGEIVPLGPQEISVIHKLIQGREKDRLDMINMDDAVRAGVEKIIDEAGLHFKLENGVTSSISELTGQTPGKTPNYKIWEVVNKVNENV